MHAHRMRTFVVRLIERRLEDQSLRGVVEDISTGLTVQFTSSAELTDFLAQPSAGTDTNSPATLGADTGDSEADAIIGCDQPRTEGAGFAHSRTQTSRLVTGRPS